MVRFNCTFIFNFQRTFKSSIPMFSNWQNGMFAEMLLQVSSPQKQPKIMYSMCIWQMCLNEDGLYLFHIYYENIPLFCVSHCEPVSITAHDYWSMQLYCHMTSLCVM